MVKRYRNEGDVKERVKEILSQYPCWWFMPVQSGYGVRGVPDFIVCADGQFVSIETKFGKNELSVWQKIQGDKIRQAEGLFCVVNEENVENVKQILDVLYKRVSV